MKSNLFHKILSIFFLLSFACTCVSADTVDTIAEKIRQAKVDAHRQYLELSDEINHIHDDLTAQASSTLSPTSVSSRKAVENMDFVQLLRDSIPVITGINSARRMNAAQENSLWDTINQIEDEEVRASFDSRLQKLSSARMSHEEDAKEIIATLTKEMIEVDSDFPTLTISTSSEQLTAWVREFQNYLRNNPYSLHSQHFVSIESTLSQLKSVRMWMDSLSEEFTALKNELADL